MFYTLVVKRVKSLKYKIAGDPAGTPLRTSESVAQLSFPQRIKYHIVQSMVKAKRGGAWFSLDRSEKSILYLSVRLQLKFESLDLLRSLASILKKLEERGQSLYACIQRGTLLAWRFSEFAVTCGNEAARAWRNDRAYAIFLGRISTPKGAFAR